MKNSFYDVHDCHVLHLFRSNEMYKTFTLFSPFWGETRYLTFAEKRGVWVFESGLLTTVYRIKRQR